MAEDIKQTIVERIRKIMETAGRTEAEMLTAQNLCQKLMMRYNIDKNDIFVSDTDIGITFIDNTFEGHETRYWTWDLLCRIGNPYSVQVVRTEKWDKITGVKSEVYKLVGSKDDREMVKTIFDNILPVIRASRKLRWKEYMRRVPKAQQTKPATFAKSYFNGYGIGIYEKLKGEREEFLRNMAEEEAAQKANQTEEERLQLEAKLRLDAANMPEGANSMELMALSGQQGTVAKWNAIVKRKRELVDDFMKQEFSEAEPETDRKSKRHSDDAFQSGYVDGKQRYHGHQLSNGEENIDDVTYENIEQILSAQIVWPKIRKALVITNDNRDPKILLPVLKKLVTVQEYKAFEIFINWCYKSDNFQFAGGNFTWAVSMCAAKMKGGPINHNVTN